MQQNFILSVEKLALELTKIDDLALVTYNMALAKFLIQDSLRKI